METQLFDWDGWDTIDEGAYCFYDCVLKVDVGEYKAGQKFDHIYVDYQRSYIQIGIKAYRLTVSVGEQFEPGE